jgi:hypothetical protein
MIDVRNTREFALLADPLRSRVLREDRQYF